MLGEMHQWGDHYGKECFFIDGCRLNGLQGTSSPFCWHPPILAWQEQLALRGLVVCPYAISLSWHFQQPTILPVNMHVLRSSSWGPCFNLFCSVIPTWNNKYQLCTISGWHKILVTQTKFVDVVKTMCNIGIKITMLLTFLICLVPSAALRATPTVAVSSK